jgi:hypothetical protein
MVYVTWKTRPGVELDSLGPRIQLTLRYTAEGSGLENDMIVYMMAVASDRPERGGFRINPIGIQTNLCINLAKGKGEVKLNSNDYRDQPYLDYNYLAEEEDRRRFREGVKMLVGLENHPAMSSLIEERLTPLDTDLQSDKSLDSWLMKEVTTGHHISCTTKMGPKSDPNSVVDQTGKVHGIKSLRVVDASIMPWTFPVWSTTELGSDLGPILVVQEIWWPVVTSFINQESSDLSDCKSVSSGVNRSSMRDDMAG